MNNMNLFHKFVFINQMLKKRNANEKSITHGQGRILMMLNRKDGLSTKELSEIFNIKVTSLNETLNKLIDKGYIEKRPSNEDKRILLIYLTDKGREFKFEKPKDLDVFDCLNESQKEELDKYLTLITHEIHEKMRKENPEKFEKMYKHRQEVFKKYFGCDENKEWFNIN